jgi:hypothetical protein
MSKHRGNIGEVKDGASFRPDDKTCPGKKIVERDEIRAVITPPKLPPDLPSRDIIRKTLKGTPATPGSAEKLEPIDRYRQEYDRLPPAIKARTTDTWEDIKKRLTPEKLRHIQDMQGGGELFGIDMQGKVLFKDKGTHPVMYGYVYGHDRKEHMIEIYDRDKNTNQMNRIDRWATCEEIRDYIKEKYELFKDDGMRISDSPSFGFGDEMEQAEAHTKKSFIFCKVHNLMSWVISGNDPETLHVAYNFKSGGVGIREIDPKAANERLGVIRMLRV